MANISTNDSGSVLNILRAKCTRFAEDETRQSEGTLDSVSRRQWISILANTGYQLEARAFLAAGPHDSKAQRCLARTKDPDNQGFVRCSKLGCNREAIIRCFESGITSGLEGESKNSPANFILDLPKSETDEPLAKAKTEIKTVKSINSSTLPINAMAQPPKLTSTQKQATAPNYTPGYLAMIGFKVSKTTGEVTGLNENCYARHLLSLYDLVYATGDRFYQYRSGVWKLAEENALSRMLRDTLHKYVPDFWTEGIESKYIAALEREAPFVAQMDANRQYLNLNNGMLDLETMSLVLHAKEFYSTVRIPLDYDAQADCPRFKQFLNEIFEGDAERIRVAGEMMGYCLTAETKAQRGFILYGSGANGKSKLVEIMQKLVGYSNTSALPLNELSSSFARFELVNKILNVATENEVKEGGLNTEYFKAITTGDSIRVEQKYREGFLYQPICKLVFAMNTLPFSKDKSFGFQRRLVIIPFNKRFEHQEDDKNLSEKLEQELAGILNFALDGLKRLRENDYQFTESSAIATVQEEYREMINPMHLFSQEYLVAGSPEDKVHYNIIAQAFKAWCQTNGHTGLANTTNQRLLSVVRQELADRGVSFELGRSGEKGRFLSGVQLKTENGRKTGHKRLLKLVNSIDEFDEADAQDEIDDSDELD